MWCWAMPDSGCNGISEQPISGYDMDQTSMIEPLQSRQGGSCRRRRLSSESLRRNCRLPGALTW